MRYLIGTLVTLSLFCPSAAIAAGPQQSNKTPRVNLNLEASPDGVKAGGGLNLGTIDLAGIAQIKNLGVKIIDSGKVIIFRALIQWAPGSAMAVLIKIDHGRWTTVLEPIGQ